MRRGSTMMREGGKFLRKRRGLLRLCAIALVIGATPGASSARDGGIEPVFDGSLRTHQRQGMSLDEAVAMVQGRYEAKVVKAETVEQRGRLVHRIRLLSPDGRVWTVSVDALSGQIR